jgi:hypothetical protein
MCVQLLPHENIHPANPILLDLIILIISVEDDKVLALQLRIIFSSYYSFSLISKYGFSSALCSQITLFRFRPLFWDTYKKSAIIPLYILINSSKMNATDVSVFSSKQWRFCNS